MTTMRMRIACWIPKATNTQSKYVIPILHMHHSVGVSIIMCINISSHIQHKTHCANQALIHGYKNLTTKVWSVFCAMGNVGTQYVIIIAFPLQQ